MPAGADAESAPLRGRTFQFWLYRVSHGELLIRSPKGSDHPRNMDLMFFEVESVDLPRFLPDLLIAETTESECARACERLGRPVERRNVVTLSSHGRRFIVVASAYQCGESDMDIFDSPFVWAEEAGLGAGRSAGTLASGPLGPLRARGDCR